MTVEEVAKLTFKRITPPEPGRYLVYIRNKCPIAPEKGKEICLTGDWFIKNFSSEFGWKLENWEGDMLAIQALPETTAKELCWTFSWINRSLFND